MEFCVLEYLYRDAANWKTYGRVLFEGAWSVASAARLEGAVGGDRLFIAEDVGLPSLQEAHVSIYGADPELDHGFHELVELRAAAAADLDGTVALVSLGTLVQRFEAAGARWRCFL